MRTVTTLPHDTQEVGVLWDSVKEVGNYDNWGRLPVTKIILHSMDGYVIGTTSWFKSHNQSANYGIGMDGKITAWIPEDCVAYHAGDYSINQVSIGIEAEDNGNNGIVRTDALYETEAQLVADLCRTHNISCDEDHILLHNQIVPTSCPGTLDRNRIIVRAKELLATAPVKVVPIVPKIPVQMMQVDPDVFINLVTKSREYDDLWKALGLDLGLELKVGSHQLIVDTMTSRITEAQSYTKSSVQPPIPQTVLPSEGTGQNITSIFKPSVGIVQDISTEAPLLSKDVIQIFSEFLMFLKLKKAV